MQTVGLNFLLIFGTLVGLHWGASPLRGFVRAFRRFAAHRSATILFSGLFPVIIRLLLLPVFPAPSPAVHDEFSYLLGGDTFAAGRLTNPPHPMWVHLETFHELMQPSYASKYPPAQGLFLGFGQKVFGHPWAGVLISTGLMCAAICWMLQGWLPPAWALLGALIAILRFGVFEYWMNSYWGGAVSAIGGALVLGALPRLRKSWSPRDGLWLGLGIAILANSRPFEGVVLTAACGAVLLFDSWRARRFVWMLPACAVLAICGAAMAYYNFSVTGKATQMPYTAYERQYSMASAFIFQSPGPAPVYRHKDIHDLYAGWDVDVHREMRSDMGAFIESKLVVLWAFFIHDWPLSLVLPAIPFLVMSRRARLPLLLFGIFLSALMLQKATLPHYAGPAAGLIVLILTLGLYRLLIWNPGHKPTGSIVARIALAGTLFFFIWNIRVHRPVDLTGSEEFKAERSAIVKRLTSEGGEHLVLVRYSPTHNVHDGWIFNAADIDGSRIVWARDTGAQELLRYFKGRKAWLFEPDSPEHRLQPYPAAGASGFTAEARAR
jgi:hypothetical protein